MKELIEQLHKDTQEIKIDIAKIKVDLRHHIKRSDKHERIIMILVIGAASTAGAGAKFLLPYLMKILGV